MIEKYTDWLKKTIRNKKVVSFASWLAIGLGALWWASRDQNDEDE